MQWIVPSDTDNASLENRLWDAADQFCANSGLKAQEYSASVLGPIILQFGEGRFAAQRARLETHNLLLKHTILGLSQVAHPHSDDGLTLTKH